MHYFTWKLELVSNILWVLVDIKAFLWDDSILPCNCKGSDFIDKDHLYAVPSNLGDIKW